MMSAVRALVLVALMSPGCDAVFRLDHVGVVVPDAAPDASGFGPWAAPTPLATLNTADRESDPSMTADGLQIYFSSGSGLYRASRASVDQPFETPTSVTEVIADGANAGHVSGDNLRFYYNRYDSTTGTLDVYVMTRANTSQAFASPTRLDAISSTADDRNPTVSDNELAAIITHDVTATDKVLYSYDRATTSATWSGRRLDELDTPFIDSAAHLSPDGLAVVFHSDRIAQNGELDIYLATRPDRLSLFSPPTLLAELSSALSDADPYLSPDLATIVFARGDDLWISSRARL